MTICKIFEKSAERFLRQCITAVMLLLLLASLAEAEAKQGKQLMAYGDIPFGISANKTKNLLKKKFRRVDELYSHQTFVGYRAELRKGLMGVYYADYNIYRGKLVSSEVVGPDDFVEKYMKKKFGEPTRKSPTSVTCGHSIRSTGTYNLDNLIWDVEGGMVAIEYQCRDRSLTKAGVIKAAQ
ncbi:MAG: hypothetical protein PHH28_11795 [Desulfuromonadaceae bacterium]|nr:hypothetical protein [Desulfuromonadaceae bacterium]